ncbi:uncharacterized protein QC763_503980 [Podospora pseudopauciseta]|uniref:Uncharacterized protein n=1 Tax=Podospora pseudopauciseta TaxID=2093780 RepID=A0ABR0H891_9PEZI|nr:hypothetical protein QC763_503980 [Podospora pseudopauciseta]
MDIIQDDFSSLDLHEPLSPSHSGQLINNDRLARIMEIRRLESPDINPPRYHDPSTPPSSPPQPSSISSSPGTLGSPPRPPQSPPQFPQFSLFPGELQNLIWDHAAQLLSSPTSTPGIHFLLQPPLLSPNTPPLIRPAPFQLSTPWLTNDLDLIPTRDSFCLNLANLLLTCRASRAAILRNNASFPFAHNRTILRSLSQKGYPMLCAPKSVDLSLDLHRDLVSLTSANGTCDEVRRMLDFTDGNHFMFSAARKFAVRYGLGWELPTPGPFQHDRRCPTGWMGMRGGGRPGFCSRCVGRLVERFRRLEEVWVLVDLPEKGWKRVDGGWGRKKEFEGWDRRWFAVEGVGVVGEEGNGNGGVVEEGLEVLERVKSNLKDPRYYHMPWVSELKFGLLGWEKST